MSIGRQFKGAKHGVIMQPEEFFATQRAHGTLNFPTHATPLLHRSRFEGSIETKKMTTIDESVAAGADIQSRIGHVNGVLYLYGTPPLILFCVISIAINIKVLMSVFWIKRPLSPTLHISLSLAGADAFSSTALGIGLIMNSFIPYGLGIELKGISCFLLALEAVRLGGIIITVFHLMALAINHYLGILKPLHYLSIMTYRNTTFLLVLLWVLPIFFFALYFSLIENEGFQSAGCEKNAFLYHKQFRMLFSSLFFGPFALMVCIYVHIFYIVKKHQATRLRFRRAGSSFRPRAAEALRSTSKQMAKNVKAVHTTLFILGSFLIGWMPGVIMYMLVCEDCLLQFNWMSGHGTFFTYTIINCLIILKTLVNPVIYAARMHEIKAATRRMNNSFCEWVTTVTGFTTNRGVNRVHSSEKTRNSERIRNSEKLRSSERTRSIERTRSRHHSNRSQSSRSQSSRSQSSRSQSSRSHSRHSTCRSSHNVSIQRARNGSTYACTVCSVRECGNTLV